MPWRLNESTAIGSLGGSRIDVFPANPERAARLQTQLAAGAAWEIAAVRPVPHHSVTPEEIYGREDDLICRYRQTQSDVFAFQLDWQLLPAVAPFAGGVELWLSVQTDLLDSQPELEVTSVAAGSQAWRVLAHSDLSDEPLAGGDPRDLGPAAMICHSETGSGDRTSGLWLIEPSDQCHARLCSPPNSAALSVRLFGHFMEKGVIRRGRMRFLQASGEIRDADIAGAYQQFASSPLPLTA